MHLTEEMVLKTVPGMSVILKHYATFYKHHFVLRTSEPRTPRSLGRIVLAPFLTVFINS